MRPQQQNRRMRGRNNNNNNNNNNRKGPNPLTRSYESNGPDVKIRGSAQQIAEKYLTLARDAQSSGDRVMAENYLQHAEHYNRIIAAAQAQMPQQQQPFRDMRDDADEDDDGEEFEGQGGFDQQQPRQVNDGTGPQPEINGVPAEIALNQEAAMPGGEQRANGAQPGQPDGEGGQRRSRRQRRRNRFDRPAGEDGTSEGGADGDDDQDGNVAQAAAPAERAPQPATEAAEPQSEVPDPVA